MRKLTGYQKHILERLGGQGACLVHTVHPFPVYVCLEFVKGSYRETIRKDALPPLLPYLERVEEQGQGTWKLITYRLK